MKKLITIFVVSLSITLVSTSVANASFSKVFTDGSLIVPAGVTPKPLAHPYLYSHSFAKIIEWGGGEVLVDDDGYVTDTHALANIASSKAEGWTTNLYVASEAVAAPPQFQFTGADGYAIQQWPFIATAGDHEFIRNYTISKDMDTDVPGEKAHALNRFGLYVVNASSGQTWSDSRDVSKDIYDGESYCWQDNGFLSVTGNFADGDRGYLTLWSWSHATANTVIPAPGTLVLGAMGIALVGWLRRRRTL